MSDTRGAAQPQADSASAPGSDAAPSSLSSSASPSAQPGSLLLRTVPWAQVALFTALSHGLVWALAFPMWNDVRGLQAPFALPLLVISMFVPSFAALVCKLLFALPNYAAVVGLRWPARTTDLLLAWFIPPLLVLLSLVLSTALGWYHPDLTHLSGIRALAQSQGNRTLFTKLSPHTVVALYTAGALLLAPWVNALPALGEEAGWRGFLHSRLQPLGPLRTALITGLVWGTWHLPFNLLGYNYPGAPRVGSAVFVLFCTVFGALLTWLRLRSGSAVPPALAHGALNAASGAHALFARHGQALDPLWGGFTGVSGIAVTAAAAVVLLLLGASRDRPPARPKRE